MTYPGIENDPAAVAADPDRTAVEERRKARDEEYSKYVATQDIPWGSVPAYLAGEQVATTTAEKYGWLDLGLVRLADTAPAGAETPTASDAGPQHNAATETAAPVTTAETVTAKAGNAKAPKTGGSE
jgi:hypothetical protein